MSPRSRFLTTAGALACVFCPLDARAASFSNNVAVDTFVSSANPANNYGAAGALSISQATTTTPAKSELDSYIRFNLASTKANFDGLYGAGNWMVQSITLQLTTTTPNNGVFNSPNTAGTFTITSMQSATADTWVEGGGTPGTPSTAPGTLNFGNHLAYLNVATDVSAGTFTYGGGASGTATVYTLTLSGALVANVMAGGDTNFYLSAADPVIAYTFNSNNNTTAATHPVLTVNAVPEPGAATTAGVAGGLCALVFAARRRRVA